MSSRHPFHRRDLYRRAFKKALRLTQAPLYWLFYLLLFPVNLLLAFALRRKDPEVRKVYHVSFIAPPQFHEVRALRNAGLDVSYVVNCDPRQYWLHVDGQRCDINLRTYRTPLFLRFIHEMIAFWRYFCDVQVVHIHHLTSLTYGFWELRFLHRMGVLVVFHFRGCDIRQRLIQDGRNIGDPLCAECEYNLSGQCAKRQRIIKRLQRAAFRYGDLFLVTTPDLLEHLPKDRPAILVPFYSPEVPWESIIPQPKRPGSFRIVHATNHEGIDGTGYLRNAVKELQAKGYDIDLVVLKKVPYEEALAHYKSADLCVGKLRMGFYANFQIESMSLGIPTICSIRPEFRKYAPDCPILVADTQNIRERIEYCLTHREEIQHLGRQGIEYVRHYHCNDEIARYIIHLYQEHAPAKLAKIGTKARSQGY